MNETVEISAEFVYQTESAVEINDGDRVLWLPKSQLEYEGNWNDLNAGEAFCFDMPEWLAKQKDLI